MTETTSRKKRGQRTQNLIASWFASHGWPHAESAGAGRPGEDVTGMPGLAVEVKARRELRLMEWLRQAATHSAGVPLVVHRPDGLGEASVGDWPVTMRLDDATRLLRDAGYGIPIEEAP